MMPSPEPRIERSHDPGVDYSINVVNRFYVDEGSRDIVSVHGSDALFFIDVAFTRC
jgi:hypothetical protein